jgi:hypothetical protein
MDEMNEMNGWMDEMNGCTLDLQCKIIIEKMDFFLNNQTPTHTHTPIILISSI